MDSILYQASIARRITKQLFDYFSRREVLVSILFGVASCVLAGVLVLTNGNILTASVLLIGVTVFILSFYRLDWGLNILVGAVLLFDQFAKSGFYPLTFQVHYFYNLQDVPYLPRLEGVVLSAFELHFLFLFSVWLLVLVIKKAVHFGRIPVWFSALLFVLWLILSFVYGQSSGGTLLPALWETRGFAYLALFYFFVPQVVQTKEQIQSLMWVCIAAVSVKAFQGVASFVSSGFSFWSLPYHTAGQEDPVFIVTILVFLIALSLFGGHRGQRRALLWLLVPLVLGFLSGNRRATYVSGALTVVALVALLPPDKRRKVVRILVTSVILSGIYVGLFWNDYGRFGIPAQQLKSIVFFDDPTMMRADKYSSNLYREFEKYNLSYTIRGSPILGIGFGKKYERPTGWDVNFGLNEYVAHNSLLWLFAKAGVIGFFFFCFFFDTYLFYGASLFSRLKDPYLKAVCAVSLLAIINQVVVNYVEMEFIYYRNMVFLGTMMGLLPALEAMNAQTSLASSGASVHPT